MIVSIIYLPYLQAETTKNNPVVTNALKKLNILGRISVRPIRFLNW